MTTTLPKGTADALITKLFPTPKPYSTDPAAWIRRKSGWLWSKQEEICESVVENRFTAVRSCHGSGKSYIAGHLAAWWIDQHPVGEAFVVTTAPSDKQVKAILWREIGRAHRKGELAGRINLDAEWYIGQELVAFGRKPADHVDADEARQAFQGIHARYVLVILDEACGIPQWLWEASDTLVTNEDSRVLAIGNPDDPSTEFYQCFQPGSDFRQIHISAFDLPAFTGEYVPEKLEHLLTGRTWVDERARKWGSGSMLYTSKVLGDFPEVTEDTLITPAMVRLARDNTDLKGTRVPGRLGVDVARYGKDETTVYRCRGGSINQVATWAKRDTMETADLVAVELDRYKDSVPAVIDVIGLGAGVYDRLRQRGYRVVEFNSAARALEPRKFKNRRAEAWWNVREMFEDQTIALDPDDDDLAAELMAIKWYVDSTGRTYVEPKEETAKRLGHSPDRADAMMMACMDVGEWMEALGVGRTSNERDRKAARKKELTHGLLKEPL